MNRLTDTELWKKGWFLSLTATEKCAMRFISDNCDNAGVWEPIFTMAEMAIFGSERDAILDWDTFRTKCRDRYKVFGRNNLWWDKYHIGEQIRGPLSVKGANWPHQKIIGLLTAHGLLGEYRQVEIGLFRKSDLPTEELTAIVAAKQEEFGVVSECDGHRLAIDIIRHLNTESGRKFSLDSKQSHNLILDRLKEVRWDAEGVKAMIKRQCGLWMGTEHQEYLQPSTLFSAEKFQERYDKRNEPLPKINPSNGTNKRNPVKGADRNAGTANQGKAHTYRVNNPPKV
jgi:uncharacterized phage protein (TIGR02220 family)